VQDTEADLILSYYFAGELFDFKHLVGNALLADKIFGLSKGKFKAILPQELEQASERGIDIRNDDLEALIRSDLALFNFDGTDLDSGTVVEFVIAKMLDIPCVTLRTDFRNAGDQKEGSDWNLMCSGYPRSEEVSINAIALWKDSDSCVTSYVHNLSEIIVSSFEEVLEKNPLISNELELKKLYSNCIKLCGGNLDYILNEREVEKIITRKLFKQKKLRSQ